MIAIIRDNVSGDFVWLSRHGPVTMSTRPSADAELEDFIMRDVFPEARSTQRFTASRLLLIRFAQNRGTVQLGLRARQALLRIGIRQAGMNVDERAAVTWAIRIEERSVKLRASVDRSLRANRDTAAKREKRCCAEEGNCTDDHDRILVVFQCRYAERRPLGARPGPAASIGASASADPSSTF